MLNPNNSQICVIDGQGGGIGSAIIRKLRETFGDTLDILALGTNAIATTQMLKAKANRGASGDNAIIQTVKRVPLITGPLGIVLAHAMMGEVSPQIAEAVASSPAPKVLLPLSQENIRIVGTPDKALPRLIDDMIINYLITLYGFTVPVDETGTLEDKT